MEEVEPTADLVGITREEELTAVLLVLRLIVLRNRIEIERLLEGL